MLRKRRIAYPGAIYHGMSRGDQREDIFRDDEDRQKFLTTLGEACGKTEYWSPQPNLVFGLKWLLGVHPKNSSWNHGFRG